MTSLTPLPPITPKASRDAWIPRDVWWRNGALEANATTSTGQSVTAKLSPEDFTLAWLEGYPHSGCVTGRCRLSQQPVGVPIGTTILGDTCGRRSLIGRSSEVLWAPFWWVTIRRTSVSAFRAFVVFAPPPPLRLLFLMPLIAMVAGAFISIIGANGWWYVAAAAAVYSITCRWVQVRRLHREWARKGDAHMVRRFGENVSLSMMPLDEHTSAYVRSYVEAHPDGDVDWPGVFDRVRMLDARERNARVVVATSPQPERVAEARAELAHIEQLAVEQQAVVEAREKQAKELEAKVAAFSTEVAADDAYRSMVVAREASQQMTPMTLSQDIDARLAAGDGSAGIDMALTTGRSL